MLEKVKNFYEDHEEEILIAGGTALLIAIGFTAGRAIGIKQMHTAWKKAITACLLVDPSIEPLLTNAANEVLKIRNG